MAVNSKEMRGSHRDGCDDEDGMTLAYQTRSLALPWLPRTLLLLLLVVRVGGLIAPEHVKDMSETLEGELIAPSTS